MELENESRQFDLAPLQVPPRSTLFHLEPIGIGTPYVESLSGYIARLAKEHFLSTRHLMAKIVAPLICKPNIINDKGNFKRHARAMNGLGVTATDLIRVLQKLTLRDDLQLTTMVPWAGVLPLRFLIKPIRAWCPECYEEWQASNKAVYEPLIWALAPVTACCKHYIYLDDTCPYCGHQQHHLSSGSRPGHCFRCTRWLGRISEGVPRNHVTIAGGELEWQRWVYKNIGEILALSSLANLQARANFAKGLAKQIDTISYGRINDFSLLLSVDGHTVRQWLKGKQLPTLEMLLQVSARLNQSLVELLCIGTAIEPLTMTENPSPIKASLSKSNEGPINWEEARERLQLALEEFPPRGVEPIAQQIGISKETLKRRFPELCRNLSASYLSYHKWPLDFKKAQSMLKAALTESPPPSLQQVNKRLGRGGTPGSLRRYFPEECSTIVKRYAEYKKRPIDRDSVRRILETALKETPPKSFRSIAHNLGPSRGEIIEIFPTLSKAISARYRTYQKELNAKNRREIPKQVERIGTELYTKGIYPSFDRIKENLTVPATSSHLQDAVRALRRKLGLKR